MVELTYEYDGAQYIHWAVVAAIIVVLVYYVKQYYCDSAEGLSADSWRGAIYGGAADIRSIEQDQGNLSFSTSGRTSVYGVPALNAEAQYSEGFLGGREYPWIDSPAGMSAHTYNKAVHDVKQATAPVDVSPEAFYEGASVSPQMSSAKIGLTEDDVGYLLGT